MLGKQSAVLCPRCVAALSIASVEGQRILYCERCQGMLVPMAFFVELVQDIRAKSGVESATLPPFDPRDLDRRTDCPQCGQQMDTHPYGGGGNVVIGGCEQCAVNWLDCGALGRIARAHDRRT